MGRCQLLQVLAVLGTVALPASVDQAIASEQLVAQAAPSPVTPAQQLKKQEDVPPGGCTPIGMTASGEMVFPLLCRALLEQQRGPIAQEVPASSPKQDAAVTTSKRDALSTVSKQDAPAPDARPESSTPAQVATTPPNPEPPTTTAALPNSEGAPQLGPSGKPMATRGLKRAPRKRQLAGQHEGAPVPPGSAPAGAEVTGSVRR